MGSWLRSRRRRTRLLLLAGLVAALALASSALAGTGYNAVFNLGVVNTIDGYVTTITGDNPGSPTLLVHNTSSADSSSAIKGEITSGAGLGTAGVWGQNTTSSSQGYGVVGRHFGSGIGVYGASTGGPGVLGYSYSGYGVEGSTHGGLGVYGNQVSTTSPNAAVDATSASNGKEATAFSATLSPTTAGFDSAAVRATNNGTNANGYAVIGRHLGSGVGVAGISVSGTAVIGASPSGVGVHAAAGGSGTALKVSGKNTFSRSGAVSIAAPSSSATFSYAGLTSATTVLATVQGTPGAVWVESARVDVASGKITIYLNAAPAGAASVRVAYFVLN